VTPEWIAVGISLVVAVLSGFQIWQNLNIKLALSTMEIRLSEIRFWASQTFVSKTDHLNIMEMLLRDAKKPSHD
jgi:hypothetical protein